MRRHLNLLLTKFACLLLAASFVTSTTAQELLRPCRGLLFSTEEEFVTKGPQPSDGNPIISDGDLLSWDPSAGVVVCARNRDLLKAFQIKSDLGLDAVDVLVSERSLYVFSTELDDPGKRFTAGDLLDTNGTVVPNAALLAKFDVEKRLDLGLDAVQLIGDPRPLQQFFDRVRELGRDALIEKPETVPTLLAELKIDIWFSTEGTGGNVEKPLFLDGDLLSAAKGIIVASNSLLLPPSVPAGIPNRGVDFGLDAVTTGRSHDREAILFSTSLLFEGKPQFTDGDILKIGNGVVMENGKLIAGFEPAASFVGLDALASMLESDGCSSGITNLGGLQVHVSLLNPQGRTTTSFATDHPFGKDVPFWGNICDDVTRFRVVFRKASDGPGAGTGIPVLNSDNWIVMDRNPATLACDLPVLWFSDADGWFDAARYRKLRKCNGNLILTNWKSGSAPDPEGLYRVWLEYERGSGVEIGPAYRVQLDNKEPQINNLGLPGGDCITYTKDDMPMMVQGDMSDPHFWGYQILISGNLYVDFKYPRVNYYDAVPGAAHLNATGTTPVATLQDLHAVTVFDLDPNAKACAYSVRVRAYDRTIVGSFQPPVNTVGGYYRSPATRAIHFDFEP